VDPSNCVFSNHALTGIGASGQHFVVNEVDKFIFSWYAGQPLINIHRLNGKLVKGALEEITSGIKPVMIDYVFPLLSSQGGAHPNSVLLYCDNGTRLILYNYVSGKCVYSAKNFLPSLTELNNIGGQGNSCCLPISVDPFSGKAYSLLLDEESKTYNLVCLSPAESSFTMENLFRFDPVEDVKEFQNHHVCLDSKGEIGFALVNTSLVVFSIKDNGIKTVIKFARRSLLAKHIKYVGYDEKDPDFPYTFLLMRSTELTSFRIKSDFSSYIEKTLDVLLNGHKINYDKLCFTNPQADVLLPESSGFFLIQGIAEDEPTYIESHFYHFPTNTIIDFGGPMQSTDRVVYLSSSRILLVKSKGKTGDVLNVLEKFNAGAQPDRKPGGKKDNKESLWGNVRKQSKRNVKPGWARGLKERLSKRLSKRVK